MTTGSEFQLFIRDVLHTYFACMTYLFFHGIHLLLKSKVLPSITFPSESVEGAPWAQDTVATTAQNNNANFILKWDVTAH